MIADSDINCDSTNSGHPYLATARPLPRDNFRHRGTSTFDIRLVKTSKLSVEFFNLLNADSVVFVGGANLYGAGILATSGEPAPIDARFAPLRHAGGNLLGVCRG